MIDLRLPQNEEERVRLWKKFEEIADDYPEIWSALEVVFSCPKDVKCEMCFLIEKVAPILCRVARQMSNTQWRKPKPSVAYCMAHFREPTIVIAV